MVRQSSMRHKHWRTNQQDEGQTVQKKSMGDFTSSNIHPCRWAPRWWDWFHTWRGTSTGNHVFFWINPLSQRPKLESNSSPMGGSQGRNDLEFQIIQPVHLWPRKFLGTLPKLSNRFVGRHIWHLRTPTLRCIFVPWATRGFGLPGAGFPMVSRSDEIGFLEHEKWRSTELPSGYD